MTEAGHCTVYTNTLHKPSIPACGSIDYLTRQTTTVSKHWRRADAFASANQQHQSAEGTPISITRSHVDCVHNANTETDTDNRDQHLPAVTSDSGSFRKKSLSKLMTTFTSSHLSLSRFNPTGSCSHPNPQNCQFVTTFFFCILISIQTNTQMHKRREQTIFNYSTDKKQLTTCCTIILPKQQYFKNNQQVKLCWHPNYEMQDDVREKFYCPHILANGIFKLQRKC